MANFEAKLADALAENEVLRRDNQEQSTRIASLEVEVESLSRAESELRLCVDELKCLQDDFGTETKAKQALEAECSAQLAQLNEAEAVMLGARQDILISREQVDALQAELKRESAAREAAEAGKRKVEAACREAEARAKEAEAQLREKHNGVASTQRWVLENLRTGGSGSTTGGTTEPWYGSRGALVQAPQESALEAKLAEIQANAHKRQVESLSGRSSRTPSPGTSPRLSPASPRQILERERDSLGIVTTAGR